MTEFTSTALFLGAFGFLIATCVLFSRILERVGVPVALFFLGLGVLAGSEGVGGIEFEDYHFAFRVGTLALVLILFDGGLNTSMASVRAAIKPATALATVGVAATAGLVALAAWLMGFSLGVSLLLGAVVSSTDSATVFAVLRGSGLHLKRRVGTTIELESGLNDPMAVILTVAVTSYLQTNTPPGWGLLLSIPLQLTIGAAVGIAFGHLSLRLLSRVRLSSGGLYPALTLALAILTFGAATLLQGSGFLAVYAAGIVMGNGTLPYRNGLARVHDALAWLSQITMFLMLGMLVFPSHLVPIAWAGLGLSLFLTFVARPLAVLLCLLPFRLPPRELGYVSWVGLRGAVPIVLASYPVLEGVAEGMEVFNLVFFVVVVSALVPGSTVGFVTRRLGLQVQVQPTSPALLEINSTQVLRGEIISFYIEEPLSVAGARIANIPFPEGASILLVIRDGEPLPAKGSTVLRAGDHVYLFCRTEDRPLIQLLFGRPQGETDL